MKHIAEIPFMVTVGFALTVICFVIAEELQEPSGEYVVRLNVYVPGLLNLISGFCELAFVPLIKLYDEPEGKQFAIDA